MSDQSSEAVGADPSTILAALPYADTSVPTARETTLKSGITRGDVASVAIRIFGLYLLLQAIWLAGSLIVWHYTLGTSGPMFVYGGFFAVFAGGGTWLIVKAPRVAQWLLPRQTSNATLPPAPTVGEPLQPVAFSVVGLYLAASGANATCTAVANVALQRRSLSPFELAPAIEIVMGLLLFFGSKRLALFWQRIGQPRPPRAADDDGPL